MKSLRPCKYFKWFYRNSLSEERIRSLFEKYGGIKECDGAVNGPSDGWVMISMDTMDKATSAIKGMKESGNPIGKVKKIEIHFMCCGHLTFNLNS